MVPAHASGESSGLEPAEGIGAAQSAVDEIPDGEQPVTTVELQGAKGLFQRVQFAVQIADHEVAAPCGVGPVARSGRARLGGLYLHGHYRCSWTVTALSKIRFVVKSRSAGMRLEDTLGAPEREFCTPGSGLEVLPSGGPLVDELEAVLYPVEALALMVQAQVNIGGV